jgi:hypothetical protein
LPYYVAEGLVSDLGFAQFDPVMPGQPLGNRTFGLSGFYIFFRNLLYKRSFEGEKLDSFEYVGQQWPNTELLFDQGTWDLFFSVSAFLLSLIVLFIIIGVVSLTRDESRLSGFTVFLSTYPFFIQHTLFTWPKLMAGSAVVLAIVLLLRRSFASASLAVTIAWWFHPAAILSVVAFLAVLVFHRERLSSMVRLSFFPVTSYLAWDIAWRIIGKPPNLIAQNALDPDSGVFGNIWNRAASIQQSLALDFLVTQPQSLGQVWLLLAYSGLSIAILFSVARNLFDSSRSAGQFRAMQFGLASVAISSMPFGKLVPLDILFGQISIPSLLVSIGKIGPKANVIFWILALAQGISLIAYVAQL